MRYSLSVVTPPADTPLSLDEVKTALRVDGTDEDSLISLMLEGAAATIEKWTGVTLISTTYNAVFQAFPSGTSFFQLPRTPVTAVGSVTYNNSAGTPTVLSSSDYTVALGDAMRRARIVPGFLDWWPQTYGHIDDVTIRFTAGYADAASVPADLRNLVWMLVDYVYRRPGSRDEGSLTRNFEAALDLFLPTVARPVLF